MRSFTASIRYLDQFVKRDGEWLFAEGKLMVEWTDTRVSTIGVATLGGGGFTPPLFQSLRF